MESFCFASSFRNPVTRVIYAHRNQLVFHLGEALDLLILPGDVTGVFHADFKLAGDVRRDRGGLGRKGRQPLPVIFASSQPVGCGDSIHADALQKFHAIGDGIATRCELRPATFIHEMNLAADGGQPFIRVVIAKMQAMLGAAREHAVGFGRGFGDEIVYEHADISLVSSQDERG